MYFAGLDHENETAAEGDYVLTGSPYFGSSVTSVTATVYVNGVPLNSFFSTKRQVVITPLLKKGKNEIRLFTKRLDNYLKDNDITFNIRGPGEYSVGAGAYVFPDVQEFNSTTGWQRDKQSAQLKNVKEPDSVALERVIEFEVAE